LSSIAFLAAGLDFASGFTALTSDVPVFSASFTAASVVALSTFSFALSAAAFASSFAAVFSSSVKSVRASISASFAFNASSIAFLAAGLAFASGLIALTSDTPLSLAVSTTCCAAVAFSGVSTVSG